MKGLLFFVMGVFPASLIFSIIVFILFYKKFLVIVKEFGVTFHTRAKVVEIMRQNACFLAFCVQHLL